MLLFQVIAKKMLQSAAHVRICGWCVILACALMSGVQQLVYTAPLSKH